MLIDVPGLLQTESYMRALFGTAPGRTKRELDDVVAVRLIRQRRLWHLVEMSGLPTVTLQVVPLSEGRRWVPNGEVDALTPADSVALIERLIT